MSTGGRTTSVVLGWFLIVVSVVSVVQTLREIALFELGNRAYSEQSPQERRLGFAGHVFTVVDDQPTGSTHSQDEHDGRIQPLIDGLPLGPPSYARVRRGLEDLGRYHGWVDTWLFLDHASGRQTLWLTRRLQASATESPRFEVITVEEDGIPHRKVVRGWRLGTEYRLYRATQFVSEGTWSAMPLSLSAVIGVMPLALLIIPVGTLALGTFLMRENADAGHVAR